MGRYIIKLTDKISKKDFYLEWSTVVDVPVTFGMSLGEFKDYYLSEYGNSCYEKLVDRLLRVEEKGTSAIGETLSEILHCNRAGRKEGKLTKQKIVENYCIKHIGQ